MSFESKNKSDRKTFTLFYSLLEDTEPEEFKLIIDALRKSCGM
jgi:hypothetical protein